MREFIYREFDADQDLVVFLAASTIPNYLRMAGGTWRADGAGIVHTDQRTIRRFIPWSSVLFLEQVSREPYAQG